MTEGWIDEADAVHRAAKRLNDRAFLQNLRDDLSENLNEAVKEEDMPRVVMFAASLALVDERIRHVRT